jgi:hypothetical protein
MFSQNTGAQRGIEVHRVIPFVVDDAPDGADDVGLDRLGER